MRWRSTLVAVVLLSAQACGDKSTDQQFSGAPTSIGSTDHAIPTTTQSKATATGDSTISIGSTPGRGGPETSGPPVGTITIDDMKVGQSVSIDVSTSFGWGEPRSSNPEVLTIETGAGSAASFLHLIVTAIAPGDALVTSQADPCAGVALPDPCTGARSAPYVTYLKVAIQP